MQLLNMNDPIHAITQATEIAKSCLAGHTTPLQAGRSISPLIGPPHPIWDEMGGAHGPLSAFYVAADTADRIFFLGKQVELWHPNVREQRRAELAEAEVQAAPAIHAACRALIRHVVEAGGPVQNS